MCQHVFQGPLTCSCTPVPPPAFGSLNTLVPSLCLKCPSSLPPPQDVISPGNPNSTPQSSRFPSAVFSRHAPLFLHSAPPFAVLYNVINIDIATVYNAHGMLTSDWRSLSASFTGAHTLIAECVCLILTLLYIFYSPHWNFFSCVSFRSLFTVWTLSENVSSVIIVSFKCVDVLCYFFHGSFKTIPGCAWKEGNVLRCFLFLSK